METIGKLQAFKVLWLGMFVMAFIISLGAFVSIVVIIVLSFGVPYFNTFSLKGPL